MTNSPKEMVIKALLRVGLKDTILAIREGKVFSANTFKTEAGRTRLVRQATIVDSNPPVIGRVGLPEAALGIAWGKSMTFYGRWFDDLAWSDPDYTLRKNIIALSREKLLKQIPRDDDFGVVGSYYAVFPKIMDAKHRVPLVLYDDSLLSIDSFPVILPNIEDTMLQSRLARRLSLLLTQGQPRTEEKDKTQEKGIKVDEMSAEDVAKYFPQQ